MKNNTKRALSAVCAAVCLVTAGCGGGTKKTSSESNLEYWTILDGSAATLYQNLGDTEFAKELMKKTETDVKYVHPPQGQQTEKFNLLMASSNLPDIVEYDWTTGYAGGPQKAISDGKIIDLGEYKEYAPNYFKYLEEHPEVDKLVKTDDGKYFGFAFVRNDPSLLVMTGPYVRKDWLEELGLDAPETIDEWEKVLTAFRDKKGASIALTGNTNMFKMGIFSGAYGVMDGYYHDDGVVKFGAYEPGYKDFLAKMADWYKKGLIDEAISSNDNTMIMSNILNGDSGAAFGTIGAGIGNTMANATDIEGFDLVGTKYPTLNKGDICEYGQIDLMVPGRTAAITTSCKDIEKAMKYLDYGYSEEGAMLFNFGIEGESYNMVDGYPTYTDDIVNNKEGLSMANALSKYCLGYSSAPFLQDKRYMEQYAKLDSQKNAWDIWQQTNMSEHKLPHIYPEESKLDEYARLMTDIDTYSSEMTLKFIMGIEPIENYDQFRKTLESRGINTVLKIMQDAYDRAVER